MQQLAGCYSPLCRVALPGLAGGLSVLYRATGMLARTTLLCLSLLTAFGQAGAVEVRIAVAANFVRPLGEIAALFEQRTGHSAILIPGSTGKHFAQIQNGAPFDAFFAADAERPKLLEKAGKGVAGSRYDYAIGRLVLWSPQSGLVDNAGQILATDRFRYIAIANPKLAPYGRAARELLTAMNQWERLQPQLVRGENINQALQFVRSGNAELGLLARSQLSGATGSQWLVPANRHAPIVQQAILLSETAAAQQVIDVAQSAEARSIIVSFGYELPTTSGAID